METNDTVKHHRVRMQEKLAYGIGCFGQNLIYFFVANYLLFFYTDVFGLLPATAGTLLLVTKIWDAINDPIMGIIVDKTKSRWGKFRPWLLFSPILFVPIAVLCFSAPQLSYVVKLVWAYSTYILFSMIYTASDVPYWALSSAITANTYERNSVVMYPRLTGTIAVSIATIGTLPLIHFFQRTGGALARGDRGFQLTALTYGIITVICFAITFFYVKERVIEKKSTEKIPFRDSIKAYTENMPLLLLIISGFCMNVASGAKLSSLIFYAKYNLGNEMLNPLIAAINIPFILLGIVITPAIAQHFGKKGAYILLNALFALGSLGFFLSGWNNLAIIMVFSCISSIGMASPLVLQTSMIADTIEYAQLKSGKRSEGLIFSSQTFMVKLAGAAMSWITGLILFTSGFVANAEQSMKSLQGIHTIISLLPCIAAILAIIPMIFYPLTEKMHNEILQKLQERYN